jgi:hypothetical protein
MYEESGGGVRKMSLAVFEASGFGRDDEKRLVTAEDSVWEELEKV